MKKSTTTKQWHTSDSKTGSGDFYGQAIKQKVGRIRQDYMGDNILTNKKYGKPPKSLA